MTVTTTTMFEACVVTDLAVNSLHHAIDLAPRPADTRDGGPVQDCPIRREHIGADLLYAPIRECFYAGRRSSIDAELRQRIARIIGFAEAGRGSGSPITPRVALRTLGVLAAAAGTGAPRDADGLVTRTGFLASAPHRQAIRGAGDRRDRGYAVASLDEVRQHLALVREYGLPALATGGPVDALVALIANTDGRVLRTPSPGTSEELRGVAQQVVDAGGAATKVGARLMDMFKTMCANGDVTARTPCDLLAGTLFLDGLQRLRSHRDGL